MLKFDYPEARKLSKRATAKAKILLKDGNAYRHFCEAAKLFQEQDDAFAHEWLVVLIEQGYECLHMNHGYSYLEECWPDW